MCCNLSVRKDRNEALLQYFDVLGSWKPLETIRFHFMEWTSYLASYILLERKRKVTGLECHEGEWIITSGTAKVFVQWFTKNMLFCDATSMLLDFSRNPRALLNHPLYLLKVGFMFVGVCLGEGIKTLVSEERKLMVPLLHKLKHNRSALPLCISFNVSTIWTLSMLNKHCCRPVLIYVGLNM